ncbi:helix-turn-helix transcriptional regulator [Vibrio sp. TH_r3]|uniref:helix-turn-helix domain-containing protein n=1 Tax=Vibrio sp. TH_r3 TaxID=3082084 RepID=UPI002955513B|nr:helix-turn-helix transcriptional regulator [Vibrio sp. TH_r3]MDV7103411.1 helix-turn-helix transcriptional regulator [Vibrio sp. TH_r3]
MIDFGRLLKRFRNSKLLSQNEFVDLVTHSNAKLVGLDVVTISRWENRVVIPTHQRQVEVFHAANQPYFELILSNEDLLEYNFDFKLLKKYYVWENTGNTSLSSVRYSCIESEDDNGNTLYCILYVDEQGIPIGQLTYRFFPKDDFWKVRNRSNDKIVLSNTTELCLEICSMYCFSDKILPYMLGNVIKKLLLREVNIIGFSSKNRKSSLKKFLKSIGFKAHKEQEEFSSLLLTYHDALYNKELFYCSALMLGDQGEINV